MSCKYIFTCIWLVIRVLQHIHRLLLVKFYGFFLFTVYSNHFEVCVWSFLLRCGFRGLMMPKHVVDDLGGKRTDAGNLGAGIYFADEFR